MESIESKSTARPPWNKGKFVGQKAPFKLKEIWAIRVRLQLASRRRELALFNLAIDSKLRACDLVKLKVRDVCHGQTVASRTIVMQQKTQGPVQFEITEPTREAVGAWISCAGLSPESSLFPSRLHGSTQLSTRQYARIVDSWVRQLGLDRASYGTHTLRRTKATLIYRRTKNLRAVQLLLGHTKLESTVRYLGIEVNDALEMAEQTEVQPGGGGSVGGSARRPAKWGCSVRRVACQKADAQNRVCIKEDHSMKASVFLGTSVDGFIARHNGDFDFLPEGGGEPHGYTEFIATIDVLVIGRHTFDKVLTFDTWPYQDMQVVVLSNRPTDTSTIPKQHVERMCGTPSEIVDQLRVGGAQHAYIDGGITVQQFLRAGLIQRLIITRVPVLVGQGIPLFGSILQDVKLRHVKTHSYASGLVKSEYEVAGAQ